MQESSRLVVATRPIVEQQGVVRVVKAVMHGLISGRFQHHHQKEKSMKVFVAAAVAAGLLSAAPAFASAELAKAKNCLACHAVDKKLVGPAYQEVAKKYAGQADAVAKLAEKIQKGGSGVWGTMPMPANPQVTPEEAKTLATWVLSQK